MSELYHYGVIGMKWGVRKDERKQIRSENRMARNTATQARIVGDAARLAFNRYDHYSELLGKAKNKNPESNRTKRLTNKQNAALNSARKLDSEYRSIENKAKEHVNALISKYGKDHVKDIKYKNTSISAKVAKDIGIKSDRYSTINDGRAASNVKSVITIAALSAGATFTSRLLGLKGAVPIVVFMSNGEQRIENNTYREEYKKIKRENS